MDDLPVRTELFFDVGLMRNHYGWSDGSRKNVSHDWKEVKIRAACSIP